MEELEKIQNLNELGANLKSNMINIINDEIITSNSGDFISEIENYNYFKLPHGNALTLEEIYEITAAEENKLIALIGPSASGKTTIETTLYQLFQIEPLANLCFAGSSTLLGYESRAFNTRTSSNNVVATTPRTSRNEQNIFLHLKLCDLDTEKKINYLFADIAGEEIFSYKGRTDLLVENMSYLKAVGDYAFVLDGEQLYDDSLRNGVMDSMRGMVRTIFDAKLYSKQTRVQIIISKYDIISQLNNVDISRINISINSLVNLIRNYDIEVTVHNVAAMPKNKNFNVGFGLQELLGIWHSKKNIKLNINETYIGENLKSEFNKLEYKL